MFENGGVGGEVEGALYCFDELMEPWCFSVTPFFLIFQTAASPMLDLTSYSQRLLQNLLVKRPLLE
jgi:hypothetical protein